MQVAADPVALVDDRQALHLVVQPGVLDGDPGVEGEHLDQRLVVLAELGRAQLVRQVQAADRRRHRAWIGMPRKACIAGWFGGNP